MAKIGTIVGLDDVRKQLDGLSKRVRSAAMRKGMTAATTPVLQSARAHCPVREDGIVKGGLTRKSLGKKVKTYPGGVTVGMVGARRGFRRVTSVDGRQVVQDPTKTIHLVEFGTRHSRPHPFLRPALDENRGKFLQAIASKVQEEIARTAAGKK